MWIPKPLQISTLFYIPSAIVAIYRKILYLKWMIPLLVTSSMMNHSQSLLPNRTHSNILLTYVRYFDIVLGHFIIAYHNFLAYTYTIVDQNNKELISRCDMYIYIYISTLYSIAIYHSDLCRFDIWHMSMHLTTGLASYNFLCDYVSN